MTFYYKNRKVDILRDAQRGDSGWGANGATDLVVVKYIEGGDKETVSRSLVTEEIITEGEPKIEIQHEEVQQRPSQKGSKMSEQDYIDANRPDKAKTAKAKADYEKRFGVDLDNPKGDGDDHGQAGHQPKTPKTP